MTDYLSWMRDVNHGVNKQSSTKKQSCREFSERERKAKTRRPSICWDRWKYQSAPTA